MKCFDCMLEATFIGIPGLDWWNLCFIFFSVESNSVVYKLKKDLFIFKAGILEVILGSDNALSNTPEIRAVWNT